MIGIADTGQAETDLAGTLSCPRCAGRLQPWGARTVRDHGTGRCPRAVEPGELGVGMVSAQHGDLVTQHQDLDVLGRIGASEQRQPAQHAGKRQGGESKGHSG
jgi:hypothetical protein